MKNCNQCDFCVTKLTTAKRSPRMLAEGTFTIFDDSRVMEINCAVGKWSRTFSSMKVFEASGYGAAAAKDCFLYSPEEDE